MEARYNVGALDLHDGDQTDLQIDSTGRLKVTSSGTGTSADQVQGNSAAAAVDAGNPVKVGGVALTGGISAAVTTTHRANLTQDLRSRLMVTVGPTDSSVGGYDVENSDAMTPQAASVALRVNAFGFVWDGTNKIRERGDVNGTVTQVGLSSTFWQFAGATGGIINTSDVALKAAAGASVRNYLDSVQFKNTAATASEIVIKDGSTIIWRGHVGASMTAMETINFVPPLKSTANTALNVALLTTATATIVSAQGHTGT